MRRTRVIVLVLVAAVVAALAVVDRDVEPDALDRFGAAPLAPMPIADADDVLASTWYCAAGTATEDGNANLSVVIANVGEQAATGAVEWRPVDAEPVRVPIEVPASGALTLAAVESVTAPVVSAIVETTGGRIAVEHVISGPRGSSVAPCASDASATWYLANGTTERDGVQVLALFNPFPDDAIVDITFATDEGRDEPLALSGFPIPAGSTTLVNLEAHVRRRAVTATSIEARSGRLVVDRIQSFDPSVGGRRGVSLALAAPGPAETWTFPEGLWADGLAQSWHVYNPTDREAIVLLQLFPSDGEAIEPIELTVAPRTQVAVDAAGTERIPAGVAHSSVISSINGVPVVAERALSASSPAERRGWTSSLGAPLAAERWALPLGETSGNTDEWVVVHNPGSSAVEVSLAALAGGQVIDVEGLQSLALGPGGRLALRLGDHIERSPLPLLVTATGAVVVERDLYRVGATGITTVVGIPLP
jgi:hypothetical protein